MKQAYKKPLVMATLFLATVTVIFVTKEPYHNGFFYGMNAFGIIFLVFFIGDCLAWLPNKLDQQQWLQPKDMMAAVGLLPVLLMGFYLWRDWNRYSLWQVCLVGAVMAALLIGLLLRLFGKGAQSTVRFTAWAVCLALVSLSVLGTIVIFDPLTFREAETLILQEHDLRDDYTYARTEATSKKLESPLGYYMLDWVDGGGHGRAIVYFGQGQDSWRNGKTNKTD